MSEPGIGSVEELLFFYAFFSFVHVMLWAAVSADVVVTVPPTDVVRREATRRRIGRAIAVLGVVHVGFAVVAFDVARFRPDGGPPVDAAKRHRAMAEAVVSFVAGLVSLGLVAIAVST